jgi:hypothetical protein
MKISHADPAMIQRAADAWNRGEFLNEFIPEPKEFPATENGGQMPDWWHWRIANWGVKWDIGSDKYGEEAVVKNNTFSVGFESPWSPPVEGYKKLVEMGFFIEAFYFEGGIGYCGQYVSGWDNEYSLEGLTPKQIRKSIPSKLNKMFGIADWYEEMLSEQ